MICEHPQDMQIEEWDYLTSQMKLVCRTCGATIKKVTVLAIPDSSIEGWYGEEDVDD